MDERSLEVLEYPVLLDHLAAFAASPIGREQCRNLKPSADEQRIRSQLHEVTEVRALLDAGVASPVLPFEDVRPVLGHAGREGAVLDGEEIRALLSFVEVAERARTFFDDVKVPCPRLRAMAQELVPLQSIRQAIEQTFSPDGSLRDDASPALFRIRSRLQQEKHRIFASLTDLLQRPQLKGIWQDREIRYRNDRYVVAVKSGSRHALPGILHDLSQSKATCFIEPSETVELNNQLNLLLRQEQDEIRRILQRLTERIREQGEDLQRNLEILARMDVVWAKGLLSRALDATEPELGESGPRFEEARHPLLVFRSRETGEPPPRPIRLEFPPGIRTLVVSGANMGGKTAALKTLGLMTLMVQTGMHVPAAESARAVVFDRVFSIIGDDQDLVQDLSTFSSQLRRIQEMLDSITSRSLVLLDEICTHTDPVEGSALAMSILDRIEDTGARVLVTTHYSTLKGYATVKDHALNVSVDFDERTHAPKYTLTYGIPGVSNAIESARRLGMDPRLVEGAEEHLSPRDRKAVHLIRDLDASYRNLKKEEERVLRLRKELEQAKSAYEGLSRELDRERERILEEIRREARRSLRRAETNLRGMLRAARKHLRSQPVPSPEWEELQKSFEEEKARLFEKLAPPKRAPLPVSAPRLKPGCRVKLRGTQQTGVLIRIDEPENEARILFNGMKVRARIDALELVESKPPECSVRHRVDVAPAPFAGRQVNLMGMSVEEALNFVDKVLDQALASGQVRVDLVHGVGTGRLKEAIRKYLQDHALVKGFHHPEPHRGGVGVTVVEL